MIENLKNNIFVVTLLTIFLSMFKNKSNLPNFIIIPIIVALTSKYLCGDIDYGFKWTLSDIIYWAILIINSLIVIFLYNKLFIKK